MKSFKFFRGYTDSSTPNFIVADGPDRYGRVGTRRINATWIREMAEGIANFHNIDAEAELTALLTEQMSHEINREMIRSFRPNCGIPPRYFNNELEVTHSGVRFLRTDNTPIIPGII